MSDGVKFLETIPMWDGATPFGVERIARVLELLDNPQNKIPAIHVAGTNGKGTVCTQLAAMLFADGQRVGQYCSPHLSSVTERCIVNGKPVGAALFGEMINRVREITNRERITLTYFEYVTAAAFLAFVELGVQWMVVEVGLGGRYDATNTIAKPKACVITSISFDHMKILGDTLPKIAAEKAGIIKDGVPVFVGAVDSDVRRVIEERARECRAPIEFFGSEFVFDRETQSLKSAKGKFVYDESLRARLRGYQTDNSFLSVRVAQFLNLSPQAIRKGLITARWPGRLEQFKLPLADPKKGTALCVVDAAHNEAGIEKFLEFLSDEIVSKAKPDRMKFILAVSQQKHWQSMAHKLNEFKSKLQIPVDWIVTQFDDARSTDPRQLAEALPGSSIVREPKAALAAALTNATERSVIVITGSIYLIGELRPFITDEGFSTIGVLDESQF